jgi:beta-ribofuranosylaminobenzene 5'-phosphate synthase
MIRIRTPSRLHFGPLSLSSDGPGVPPGGRRWFGGVGLMVADPGVSLTLVPGDEWAAEGPLAGRALAAARRFTRHVRDTGKAPGRPQRLTIAPGVLGHVGLGTGTQLALAVAWGLARAWGIEWDLPSAARALGRGARSALGVHGFAQGGFLVEGGKRHEEGLAPLVVRAAFPEAWRVVLIRPHAPADWHGAREEEAFARLRRAEVPAGLTDTLCRLVLLGMLPALAEGDALAFGEALGAFNARAGEFFAPAQGGIYASPRIAEAVRLVRSLGVPGVGQSSWGPTTFAVVADEDRAADLARRVRQRLGLTEADVSVTCGDNRGAADDTVTG